MPIQPVTNSIALPVETPEDVAKLFEATLAVADEASERRRSDLSRDLGDHWAFLAGTHSEWFAPYQQPPVELSSERIEGFDISFDDLTVLMAGAPDTCVDTLVQLLRDG